MLIFIWILISTFLISLIAFVGALILFLKEELLNKILLLLVAFSAGSLIGGAFLHLIPEAIEKAEIGDYSLLEIFLYLILGFCTLFILEQFIRWHHHHVTRHPELEDKIKPFSYLILISDAIHNFIDGLIIAGSFIISLPTGLITSLAIALHEIPQEIGDYGVLVYGGFNKLRALFLNFLSASAIIFGGIVGFFLSTKLEDQILFLLPFAAGTFIYIAASDLIPQIKEENNLKKSAIYFFIFLAGIILMLLMKLSLKVD